MLCIGMTTKAQITITNADLPQGTDYYLMSTANPTSIAIGDLATTGANTNWNFDLQSNGQVIDTTYDISDSPPLYYLYFLTSDYADNTVPDITFIPGLTVTDVYNFYNLTSTKLEQTGFGATINSVPLPVYFSPKDLLYELPLNYGDTYSSNTAFNVSIPTFGAWFETRDRTNEVDGWGTLQGPLGSQQVLRVRSDIQYVDSLSVDISPFPLPAVPRHVIEYKWLAASEGLPILQITTNEFLGTETITQIKYRDVPTGFEQMLADNQSFVLYPQPAANVVTIVNPFSNEQNVELYLTDATGRIVKSISNINESLIQLDVRSFPAGIYLMTLQSGTKSFVRRVAVTH